MKDLQTRIDNIQETFGLYYKPSGTYRRLLMKQESISKKGLYDYFLALEVRVDRIRGAHEINASSNIAIESLYKSASLLRVAMKGVHKEVTGVEWDNQVKETFSTCYEVIASIVEGMEDIVVEHLCTCPGKLSEDAQLIKRRTHWQKSHNKDVKKSNAAKRAWSKNRGKYKDALKKFHKSTQGKMFHRNLARFKKTRVHKEDSSRDFTLNDTLVVCKGLSSFLTNMIARVQNEYDERVDTSNIKEADENILVYREVFTLFNSLMTELFEAYFYEDLNTVSDVLEVISDYYNLVNEDDYEDVD